LISSKIWSFGNTGITTLEKRQTLKSPDSFPSPAAEIGSGPDCRNWSIRGI
jgi:hypothetical protein